MSQSVEEIARDITVAWLSSNRIAFNIDLPEKTADAISNVYTGVVQAVHECREKHLAEVPSKFALRI
jgi:SH3-like domain-containing protein